MLINKRYFYLREGCRFVKGVTGCALYDLIKGNLYSVDNKLAEIIEKGPNINSIIAAANKNMISADVIGQQIRTLCGLGLGYNTRRKIYRSSLLSAQEVLSNKNKRLRSICLRIENRCNINCKHCGNDGSIYIKNCSCFKSAISVDNKKSIDWASLLYAARRIGCERIIIIGGEPLLNNEIGGILKDIGKLSFNSVLIYSNGTIMNKSIRKMLKEIEATIIVPLYSQSEKIHDWMTGTRGSFAKLIRNINLMMRDKIAVNVKIMIYPDNTECLQGIEDFVNKEIKAPYLVDNFHLIKADQTFDKLNTNFKLKWKPNFVNIGLEEVVIREKGNSCWLGNLAVDYDGDIKPCIWAQEFSLGNIKNTPLRRIVDSGKVDKYWYLSKERITDCSRCEYRYACDDCRVNAFRYYGKLDSRYPLCSYDPILGLWNRPIDKILERKKTE